MLFKNTSQDELNLSMMGLGRVKPGATVDVPEVLWRPGVTGSGARAPSGVEMMAPQLRPASEADAEAWQEVPPPPPPSSRLRSAHGATVDASIPPGVRAAMAAAEAEEVPPIPAPRRGRPPKAPPAESSAEG